MASISDFDGISSRHADRLASIGIKTSDALLKYGATKRGRKELSKVTGLGEKRIHEWVKRADIIRVKGVSLRYCDLLEAIGIDTQRNLRRRNPRKLLEQMKAVNDKRSVVNRMPSEQEVADWVLSAKSLKPVLH